MGANYDEIKRILIRYKNYLQSNDYIQNPSLLLHKENWEVLGTTTSFQPQLHTSQSHLTTLPFRTNPTTPSNSALHFPTSPTSSSYHHMTAPSLRFGYPTIHSDHRSTILYSPHQPLDPSLTITNNNSNNNVDLIAMQCGQGDLMDDFQQLQYQDAQLQQSIPQEQQQLCPN